MSTKFDEIDIYRINTHNTILKFAPIVAISAAATFTIARLFGLFGFVNLISLICFDIVCFSYFIAAFFMQKKGIVKSGRVSESSVLTMGILLDTLVILQWNLITYIFPTHSFWGYAPMFVLITAFMFNSTAVLFEIFGISISIAISWITIGDELLPIKDDLFTENLVLRIVALVISFTVIYVLTCMAEKFIFKIKDNVKSLETKNEQLENASREIIEFTADIIEERDSTSGSHVKRLQEYTRILAEQVAESYPEYNLTTEKIDLISLACVLHDVGKIGIPDNILLKPSKLTPEEFEIVKTHTTIGAHTIDKLPDSVGSKYKNICREICLYHHEKYDGKGYPVGLKGDDIPISAQIVSVVDCFDALSNDRPYKPALPGETAINMILNGECGAFSEKIKNCLVLCKDKILSR